MKSKKPVRSSLESKDFIWLCAFGHRDAGIRSDTTASILEAAESAFNLEEGQLFATKSGDERPSSIENAVAWWRSASEHGTQAANRDKDAALSVWSETAGNLCWQYVIHTHTRNERDGVLYRDARLVLGLALAAAKSSEDVRTFATQVSELLLKDSGVGYAFIDPASKEIVPHPALYAGSLSSGTSWEKLVEQDAWLFHRHMPCDRVRGVFWGNIFGPELTTQLKRVGFDQQLLELRTSWPWSPRVIEHGGGIAVLLDDDPMGFARRRRSQMQGDESAVRGGGLLRSVLGRAALL